MDKRARVIIEIALHCGKILIISAVASIFSHFGGFSVYGDITFTLSVGNRINTSAFSD